MRIYMQIPPGDDRPPRFYHLHLQEDLLGGWTLVREWGYQGAGGRIQRDTFPDRETAEHAMLKARDERIKKGYRVVFMKMQDSAP
jgi:predicted DNA-binding WGR domain protein